MDDKDELWIFKINFNEGSNYGKKIVDFGVFGVSIFSIIFNNGYGLKSGILMVFLYVVGVVVLVLVENLNLSVIEFKKILLDNIDFIIFL